MDCGRAWLRKAFHRSCRGKPEYSESVAKAETPPSRSHSATSTYWLQCLTRVIYEAFSCTPRTESSPMIMSSPLNGGAGFAGISGRKTANACDTNAIEMSADTTAHFIFVARNSFTEVSDIVVQYVICFSRSISCAKRFASRIPVATLAQYRAVSALTCSPTATGICESKS